MSFGQVLLTLGVAVLVFDSTKLPKLLKDLAWLVAKYRQYYLVWMGKVEQLLQQTTVEQQLAENQKKAAKIELIKPQKD